VKRCD